MATIKIQGDHGPEVVLIVSPSDALKVLLDFQNKYPNAERTNLELSDFIHRWLLDDSINKESTISQ